jgi:GAG-pre-integrase domain
MIVPRTQEREANLEKSMNYCVEAIIEEDNTVSKVATWIVDSGTTHHMCNEGTLLSELKKDPSAQGVLVGNNSRLKVEHEGKVKLNFCVGKQEVKGVINGVLCILEMSKNLFGVTQAMKQGKSVLFDNKTMSCKILKDSKVVGEAHLMNGLWVLNCTQDTEEAHANIAQEEDNMQLWHQRLGHLGEDNLVKLQKKGMVKGPEDPLKGEVKGNCEGCKQGKQHKQPHLETEKC